MWVIHLPLCSGCEEELQGWCYSCSVWPLSCLAFGCGLNQEPVCGGEVGREVITGLYFKYLFIERDLTEFVDADVLLVESSPAEMMKSQDPALPSRYQVGWETCLFLKRRI